MKGEPMEVLELNLKAKPVDIPEYLIPFLVKKQLVGSRAICVPPPQDTDMDFLCLSKREEDEQLITTLLEKDGYKKDGHYDLSKFQSFKKGIVNVILTSDKDFYDKFIIAMLVCKELNVLDKKKRIKIHHLIIGEE
jgi:hypothetical protein